jgi:heavy metal sensor kinase
MFSKSKSEIFRTVTFRLTLWYVILFCAASLLGFGIIYTKLTRNLTRQIDDILRDEAKEQVLFYQSNNIASFRNEIIQEAANSGTERMFLRLIDPSGKIITASDMRSWQGILPLQGMQAPAFGMEVFETVGVPGRSHPARVLSKRTADGRILQIGISLHEEEELMEAYSRISMTAIMVLLICGGIVGWVMARRAMSGVERVTQTAQGIGKGDLVSRVPLGNEGEEINNLAKAFNDMLGRLQAMVTELEEVSSNIAHDLRSPLTRIRGIAETTLTGDQDMESFQDMAGIVIEECDRLVSMINVMLDIAMTEAGIQGMARDEVDIGRLARDACAIFQTVAEDRGVALRIEGFSKPLVIQGDVSQLQRMIANLLDNSIKFTPPNGTVTLSMQDAALFAIISIQDTGLGISEQDIPRIFDRFFRSDQSRSTPGNGLGLSHVKAIVKAHGGEIEVISSPMRGSTFIIKLPVHGGQADASPSNRPLNTHDRFLQG